MNRTYYMFCDTVEASTAWVNVIRELISTGSIKPSESSAAMVRLVCVDVHRGMCDIFICYDVMIAIATFSTLCECSF